MLYIGNNNNYSLKILDGLGYVVWYEQTFPGLIDLSIIVIWFAFDKIWFFNHKESKPAKF